ncbi:MAG: TolC family protein [Burkholderiaceae bacterium]
MRCWTTTVLIGTALTLLASTAGAAEPVPLGPGLAGPRDDLAAPPLLLVPIAAPDGAQREPSRLISPHIAPHPPASGVAVYSLDELVERALAESPLLAISGADELAAQASVLTARAYPNPELELSPGHSRARIDGTPSGFAPQVTLSQPIENPWLRDARIRAARTQVDVVHAQSAVIRNNLRALVRKRYFEMRRLSEELRAYTEDLALTELIRERVALRTRTGEGARFDLIRAESEVAVARKNVDMTRLRLRQAAAELKQAVSPTLEDDFDLKPPTATLGALDDADYERLRNGLEATNPEIAVARREAAQAEQRVSVEQNRVLPQVTLRASQDRDPSQATTRIGAVVTMPLIDRRQGPIAEARAQSDRSRFAMQQREFEIRQQFDAAWQAYRAALTQTAALEDGILARARGVLEVAEAAYRFGERGILEYLDAQRQFRLVRNELIQARFALQVARAELDRLSAAQ